MTGWICDPREDEPSYLAKLKRVQIDIIEYELPIGAYSVEDGKVKTPTKIGMNPTAMWLRIDRDTSKFWVISKSETKDGITTLTVKSDIYFLNQECRREFQSCTIGDFLTRAFSTEPYCGFEPRIPSWDYSEWGHTSSMFVMYSRMSPLYVGVELPAYASYSISQIWDEFQQPLVECFEEEDGKYLLKDVLGVIEYIREQTGLWMHIEKKAVDLDSGEHLDNFYALVFEEPSFPDTIDIEFDDFHNSLVSTSFSGERVSVLYLYWKESSASMYTVSNFHLTTNGDVIEDVPLIYPMNGNCTTAFYEGSHTLAQAKAYAKSIFAEYEEDHKVVFMSDKVLPVGQPVKLHIDSGTLDTAISKCEISSSSDWYRYTCGDIPTTAAQHISAQNWVYKRRAPFAPKKGQLLFM